MMADGLVHKNGKAKIRKNKIPNLCLSGYGYDKYDEYADRYSSTTTMEIIDIDELE